jgi:iron(III) transport system substrate-binding protein
MKKILLILLSLMLLLITSCDSNTKNSVVIYTSVDRNYSEPIFNAFEKETGIKVLAVYDVEATKTTGLVNRLINEKENPKADVFWNGEILQTIKLKENNVLDKYKSKNADTLPNKFIDSKEYYTTFGGRLRVFIVNTDILEESQYPKSVFDIISPDYDLSKIAIAKPLFGTTATHVAALYAKLEENDVYDFFSTVSNSKINIVDGNSQVRDLVSSGKLAYGLVDSDDALSAINKGLPVKIVFPDQNDNMIGTLLIPNSVSMIKNGPNNNNAKLFIDYLLKVDTIENLIESGWCQVSLRNIQTKNSIDIQNLKLIDVSYEEIYKMFPISSSDMTELFIR